MKVAILGTGSVGKSLYSGFSNSDCDVRFGSRNPDKFGVTGKAVSQEEAVEWGDIVVMAVPYHAVAETINGIGKDVFKGKIVVDVTNALNEKWELAIGFTTSAAEELAKQLPEAKVIKAFNYVFAENMNSGIVGGEKLTLFVAGDDAAAKKKIMELGRNIGFDPIDAGTLKSARYLEPLAMLNITLGYGQKMGTKMGFRLVRG